MDMPDRGWTTLETAEAFWMLTETPAMAAVMREYPDPVYERHKVELLCRVMCELADIDTHRVCWADLAEAVITWSCGQGYDVVDERV